MRPTSDQPAGDQAMISAVKHGQSQMWLPSTMLLLSFAALFVMAPYAAQPLSNTEVLLPAYAGAVFVIELITCAFLLVLFYVQRSRALLILAAGYLLSGTLVVPWVLSFPGLFTALGIDESLQSTANFATLRRLGFPAFVLAYAVLSDREIKRATIAGSILLMVGSVLAFTGTVTWLILADGSRLPDFMMDMRNPGALWRFVPAMALAMYFVGIVMLALRRRTILDLWLLVVLGTLVIEIIQISYLGAGIRMSVGWWAGRLYGLVSSSIILVLLLSETMAVYARLARSIAGERRARQNRLTAMEALSASIAHEVNQPLGSMVTNANAGLRWLEKPQPELGEAKAAMRRIVDEGHRANKVVSGIRAMFMKGANERAPLDLNRLIERTIQQYGVEARLGRASVALDLDCTLPPVIGNAIQLQQVISNLIDNAVEAMRAVPSRLRRLRITTSSVEHGEVVVSVEDSGPGLEAANLDRIFEPFFTTKADGMGMGLMFCRSTVEAHGGRLWTSANSPQGAIFSFSLPMALLPNPIVEAGE